MILSMQNFIVIEHNPQEKGRKRKGGKKKKKGKKNLSLNNFKFQISW
jgi:hypothetical protein